MCEPVGCALENKEKEFPKMYIVSDYIQQLKDNINYAQKSDTSTYKSFEKRRSIKAGKIYQDCKCQKLDCIECQP